MLISIFFLLTCNSCYFETSVPEDGSEKQRGFIQVFIDPDSLDFIRSDKLSSGTKSLIFNIEGEELNRKEIEEIQNKYGDTVFNRRMVMIGISALATEFSLIDIKSNTDFDEEHKAGESLRDIVTFYGASPVKYIEAGCPEFTGEWGNYLENYFYGFTPIEKPLSAITRVDLILINPRFELRFMKQPSVPGKQVLTISLSNDNTVLERSIEVTF